MSMSPTFVFFAAAALAAKVSAGTGEDIYNNLLSDLGP
jgi:hypothetical protein